MMKDNKLTVLLAEDDEAVRSLIVRLLKKNGYNVLEAEDGKIAQQIYLSNKGGIDAIVSDLKMPNVDGVAFAEFNFHNDYLPFIVCTTVSDSELALELFKLGIQDYLVKPVREQSLLRSLEVAIDRRSLRMPMKYDENPYAGNVGSILIHSRKDELKRASNWIENHINTVMSQKDSSVFTNYVNEFLMNSHEHGNLGIGEEEKSTLIESGTFEGVLSEREGICMAKISIAMSILKEEIAIYISDDGNGFDYNKYLNMSDESIFERIELPNGRGIFMASKYFDSIQYSQNGANVLLVKKL